MILSEEPVPEREIYHLVERHMPISEVSERRIG